MKKFNLRNSAASLLIVISLLLIVTHIINTVVSTREPEYTFRNADNLESISADTLILSPDSLWKRSEFSLER